MKTELLKKIGDLAGRVVYGPVIEGLVLKCEMDKKVPVMHVLLDTGTSGLQQKVFPRSYETFIIPGWYLRFRTRSHQYLAYP